MSRANKLEIHWADQDNFSTLSLYCPETGRYLKIGFTDVQSLGFELIRGLKQFTRTCFDHRLDQDAMRNDYINFKEDC